MSEGGEGCMGFRFCIQGETLEFGFPGQHFLMSIFFYKGPSSERSPEMMSPRACYANSSTFEDVFGSGKVLLFHYQP